jgi:hypothetical protein
MQSRSWTYHISVLARLSSSSSLVVQDAGGGGGSAAGPQIPNLKVAAAAGAMEVEEGERSRLVDKNSELKRAYREHANIRSSLSMLYCAGAILEAMWHEQSLKDLGMDVKLVHQDARLYLMSHASLHKRGFAPGMASVIQMLVAQEHRLVIPFSLKTLQCTLNGTCIPMPHGAVEDSLKRRAEPSLQALADHLTALTDIHTSLPMALAEATKGATEWGGLGLLSGSSINDIATALLFSVLSTARNVGAICYDRNCPS